MTTPMRSLMSLVRYRHATVCAMPGTLLAALGHMHPEWCPFCTGSRQPGEGDDGLHEGAFSPAHVGPGGDVAMTARVIAIVDPGRRVRLFQRDALTVGRADRRGIDGEVQLA